MCICAKKKETEGELKMMIEFRSLLHCRFVFTDLTGIQVQIFTDFFSLYAILDD